MNKFVLVYRHDALPAVEIRVTVKSELTEIQVECDAEPIFEIADELLDGAEQSLHDFTMVAIKHDGKTLVEFNHNEPQPVWDARQKMTAAESAKHDEERDNQ